MRAVAAIYYCRACGAEPVLPGVDLSFYYAHYSGLTTAGELVVGSPDSDGGASEEVHEWVKREVRTGLLPDYAAQRGLANRLCEVALDRSPTGLQYYCGLKVCPVCGARALVSNYVDFRPELDEIPDATTTTWQSLTVAEKELRLRSAADQALADPPPEDGWF